MGLRTLSFGLFLVSIGALMVFAVEDDHHLWIFRLAPMGGVLLAVGALLVAGVGLAAVVGRGGHNPADTDEEGEEGNGGGALDSHSIKAVSGLIAVVASMVAVVSLSVVTVTRLEGTDQDSMVAITTSAFGIISAVVGAYLGIKVTSDTTARASRNVGQVAVERHKRKVAQQKISAMKDAGKKVLNENQRLALEEAAAEVEESVRPSDPPTASGLG